MKLREIMSAPAITVAATAGLDVAAELLLSNGFTGLPVVDENGGLVGIVTEADLIRHGLPPEPRVHGWRFTRDFAARPGTVASVMTTPVESVTPGADSAETADLMLDARIRCLPVVDGHGVVGVVTRRDILRAALRP